MTVYQHERPAGTRRLLAVVQSAVAVAWAAAAMAGTAALGLWLLGVGHYASLGATTAAVVAMAVGGSVSPTGDLKVFGMDAAGAQGAIDLVPLGVTLAGALVLGWVFTRPLRRRVAVGGGELALRAGTALVCFLLLLALLCWAGNGTVSVNLGDLTGGGGSGSGAGGAGGSGGGPLGGLGDLGNLGNLGDLGNLGGIVGQVTGAKPSLGFRVDAGATLGAGLLWVCAVLALALLVVRRAGLPAGWRRVREIVRPAASAVVTAVLAACTAGALAGVVDGLAGKGGKAAVGGVLLGTPNGVFLGLPLGMGVPLNGKASGPLASLLPAQVRALLAGGNGRSITVSGLAGQDGRVWLLVLGVALLLLVAGMLTAVRTPRRAVGGSAAREAALIGARLGVALGVAAPCMLALAAVSVNANVSVFGFDAAGAALSLSGNLGLAVLLGLVEGAFAGFLGALLVRRFADAKRPAPESAGGAAVSAEGTSGALPPRPDTPPAPPHAPRYPASGPDRPAGPAAPGHPGGPAPQGTTDEPPHGPAPASQQPGTAWAAGPTGRPDAAPRPGGPEAAPRPPGSSYAALPLPPRTPPSDPPEDNPYRSR